jgi:hypothetical protein
MDATTYLKERQVLWARRRAIRLGGPLRHSPDRKQAERGAKAWTYRLEDNLFDPLTEVARSEFSGGDGGELDDRNPLMGNMYALHSSSALACNLFHYWRRRSDFAPIARACRLPSVGIESLRFEVKHPIGSGFERAPNLDVEFAYAGGKLRASAVEAKFCEPYGHREPMKLSPRYLELARLWETMPALRELARQISPIDELHEHLHAAQLLKHILGLTTSHGGGRYRLLYLWTDVPGREGAHHRDEIERFRERAAADDVAFQAMTYSEVIVRLARERDSHQQYVDYLAERYL